MRSTLAKVISVDRDIGATDPAVLPVSRRYPPRGAGGRRISLSWCPGNLVRCDLSHLFNRALRPGSPRYPIFLMLVVYPS